MDVSRALNLSLDQDIFEPSFQPESHEKFDKSWKKVAKFCSSFIQLLLRFRKKFVEKQQLAKAKHKHNRVYYIYPLTPLRGICLRRFHFFREGSATTTRLQQGLMKRLTNTPQQAAEKERFCNPLNCAFEVPSPSRLIDWHGLLRGAFLSL